MSTGNRYRATGNSKRKMGKFAKRLKTSISARLTKTPARTGLSLFSWRMRYAFFTVAFCLVPISSLTYASSDDAGTKNGAFLKIPTDARGIGMGGAMVSLAQGTDALHWNPAGLAVLDAKELSATHIQYYQDVHIENVAFGYPLGDSALAASVFYLDPGKLDGRDDLGNPNGTFSFYDAVASIGFGKKVSSRADGADVSLGGAVKIAQEKIADQQFQNPAIDLGMQVSPSENLNFGLAARNLSSGKANFPREVDAGASFTALKTITGALDVSYTNDAPIRLHVGGEYRFMDFQTVVRAGYQTHDALDDSTDSGIKPFRSASIGGLTLGAGAQYAPPFWQNVRFDIDYAMAPFGALGISHTVTLKTRF